jgi:hypothetical protein
MKITTSEQHRSALNVIDRSQNVFEVIKQSSIQTFEEALSRLEKTIKKAVELFVRDSLAGVDVTESLSIMDDARDLLVEMHNRYNKPNAFRISEHTLTPMSNEAKQLQETYATMKANRAARLQSLVNNTHIGHNMV